MFSGVLQIVLAFIAIAAANGSNGSPFQYRGNTKHPDLPNHCYYPEHKLTIPLNETLYPTNLEKSCFKVLCREDYVLEIKHCQDQYSELCTRAAENDYTKPFPDCCPIIMCNGQVFRLND